LHFCITTKAHPGKITPNGRGSSLAIQSIASCRTNFIVNLFKEEDYINLLEESGDTSKTEDTKILVVPPEITESPVLINKNNLSKEINENPIFSKYSQKRKELLTYFNLGKFVNPTHNNSNNIGSNAALMSHSPTHYKIFDTFIDKDKKYPNGNFLIEFPWGSVG
jgi:hypothetical protein